MINEYCATEGYRVGSFYVPVKFNERFFSIAIFTTVTPEQRMYPKVHDEGAFQFVVNNLSVKIFRTECKKQLI